ncbi:hypothetical protein CONPUDRAFT_133063 [Coniophora puteana RWD-64-598 SS2]|uniref:protein-histidine N-methyltransferase n=1 Tax=Coniophora puteana (strain RWD-64-598) TaxID=741705 RepID=R7SDY0_CONPW|nr:uncharacterized protein CONPUDRAFT_133063 [Coniophora puteana RWD-64-598 SS2]EIW74376.1 hypothetical protein CONPUDRAFT_133063 [Coniophora puteana RWD-64-598 SS2]
MSFKFDFDIDDRADDDHALLGITTGPSQHLKSASSEPAEAPCTELSLDHLLATLPPALSYATLPVPETDIALARRDLFDARFQVLAQADPSEPARAADGSTSSDALAFLDAPSDLLPRVYEGGLKTWECALDLAAHVHRLGWPSFVGKRVIEVGCGTAIPSLYVLHTLFSGPPPADTDGTQETHVHLQDYNASVLELVTFPNIFLAWYTSPAASPHRPSLDPNSPAGETDDDSSPGELTLTPALVRAFADALSTHRIRLRFFAGGWSSLYPSQLLPAPSPRQYDLVLTAETVYRADGLRPLVRVLREASLGDSSVPSVDQHGMDVENNEGEQGQGLCLVAAKVVYFGVGGGVVEFIRAVEDGQAGLEQGRVEKVWEHSTGVGRAILRVRWR